VDGEGFLENYIRGPQILHSHFLHRLCLETHSVSTTLCSPGCDRRVLLCLYLLLLGGQLCCLLHCEANFEVLPTEAIMTRTTLSDWTPWYVEELDNNNNNNLHKIKCRICGDTFTKKNSRMLSHLGYIRSTGERTTMSDFART
jgi:hypothetical protein